MYVGQPGVHRPHRHLDGKGRKESKEQQGLHAAHQGQFVPSQDIEAAAGCDVQIDQGDQHQQRAEQGVQEELEGGVNLVRATPDADDQVHRDQGGFKEDIKQDAVQRTEHADHQAREDQEGGHVLVDFAGDDFPARYDHHHVDEGRQWNQPQRDTIHAQVVVHIEALNP